MIKLKNKKQKVKTTKKEKRESLEERNRIALAFLELNKDKTFKKLPEEEKLSLTKEVLGMGDEIAKWVASEYSTNDPRKIAVSMGVKVFGEDFKKKRKGKGSEYRVKEREIVVYRDYHEQLLQHIKAPELSENLLKFLVAHQLFHHLEADRIGLVYKRFKFKTFKLGPIVKEKYIKGLSKVAAQAFTLTLLDLKISPQVFDYLTYILYTNS